MDWILKMQMAVMESWVLIDPAAAWRMGVSATGNGHVYGDRTAAACIHAHVVPMTLPLL